MKKVFFYISFVVIIFSFVYLFPYHACVERKAITDFKNTLLSGTICIGSKNIYGFNDEKASSITVPANLYLPKNIKDPVPAIIMSHGAGGIFRFHHDYKRLFLKEGFAVLMIDHFHPRGKILDNNFVDITEPMMTHDVISAYNLLKKHPLISNHIGYVGWSKGGIGTILLKDKRILHKFNLDENSFKFLVGIYTFCGFSFDEENISKTPLLLISGASDSITPASFCKNMSESFKNEHNTKYLEIDNAHHGFDNYAFYLGAYIPWQPVINDYSDNCSLKINDLYETTNIKGNMKLDSIENRRSFVDSCTKKGAYAAYNSSAAINAKKALMEFIKINLKTNNP
jgi:dienelactone hydrolase